ncbi:hypothetical protein IMY05_C1152000100 [Salix suchowensis]|nr:hypothetical protein IMY05_C1152000100 [Salix suchowensis]
MPLNAAMLGSATLTMNAAHSHMSVGIWDSSNSQSILAEAWILAILAEAWILAIHVMQVDFDSPPISYWKAETTASGQAWDGLVGAVIPTRRQFITSPNASEIFTLPELNANVILRKDGRWGPDDPFQCPQLYQPQYCHYACILKRIEDLNDPRWIMCVEYTHRTLFKFCVAKLVDEFLKDKDSFRTQTNSQWVNMLVNQLQTWYNRLSAFTTSFPNVLFLVAEVQRRWLDLRAYIDYMVIVKGELSKLRASSPKFPSCRPFIGAITYSHTVAEEFATTGVPVWLVRDLSEFSQMSESSLLSLYKQRISGRRAVPGVSQAIYVGSSDSCEKYDSIYKYSVSISPLHMKLSDQPNTFCGRRCL